MEALSLPPPELRDILVYMIMRREIAPVRATLAHRLSLATQSLPLRPLIWPWEVRGVL